MLDTEPITDWETSSATDDVTGATGAEPAAPKAPKAAEPAAAAPEPEPEPATEPTEPSRDEHGKFTRRGKRHSAKNQATAEDVPRIRELTKQNAELAAQLEAAKTPKPAESTEAARVSAAPASAPAPQTAAAPAPVFRPSGPPQAFPAFDAWLAQQGNENKSYDDYTDARADWRWQVNTQQHQQQTHAETRDKAFRDQVTASRQKYQDFDTLAFAPTLPVTAVMRHAMLESDRGAEILYHLGKNPALALQIAQGSQFSGPDAMPPMRWYLESLVPLEQPVARNADATVGSSLALVKKPGPKPPNPTRTQGTLKSGEEAPGDDDSLEDHEAYFHRGSRRRRR